MLYTLTKTVAAPGTPVALASTRTMASWVTVQAFSGNQKPIYVGGIDENKATNVSYDSGGTGLTYKGHMLLPGDFMNLREMGGSTYLDLNRIYMDADAANDGCTVNYGRR